MPVENEQVEQASAARPRFTPVERAMLRVLRARRTWVGRTRPSPAMTRRHLEPGQR